jgi:hypothetical protein
VSEPWIAVVLLLQSICGQPDSRTPVQVAIKHLGEGTGVASWKPHFQVLSEHPRDAVDRLIRELHVIDPTPPAVLPPETSSEPANLSALHVVWCIRALRYLTGGVEFRGSTAHVFGPDEDKREYFLNLKGKDGELPFFHTWMSTGTVFLAPPDAQRQIIDKWRSWYSEHGAAHKYVPLSRLDDWYF